jgi:hypothetical protein
MNTRYNKRMFKNICSQVYFLHDLSNHRCHLFIDQAIVPIISFAKNNRF